MTSIEDVQNLPVMSNGVPVDGIPRPLVSDLAQAQYGTTMGEVDRYNMQRVVGQTANIFGKPLGQVARELRVAIRRAGEPPRGVSVYLRGQVPPLEETLSGLSTGLLLSIAVIFLLIRLIRGQPV